MYQPIHQDEKINKPLSKNPRFIESRFSKCGNCRYMCDKNRSPLPLNESRPTGVLARHVSTGIQRPLTFTNSECYFIPMAETVILLKVSLITNK